MLRITEVSGTPATLRLEGRLAGPWVQELKSFTAPLVTGHASLSLDMVNVDYVDLAGLQLLRTLQGQGVRIEPCSDFVAEMLSTLATDRMEKP